MFDDILEELEARGMLKEAKESNQNPWRDGVLGAGAATLGAGVGGVAGFRRGARKAQPGLYRARMKAEAATAHLNRAKRKAKHVLPGSLLDKLVGGRRDSERGKKLLTEAVEGMRGSARSILRGGGKGLAAGAVLGGLTGVAASRLMGREKKASSQDEIEQMLLFAAFEDEIEKIAGREDALANVRAFMARKAKKGMPKPGSGSGGLLSRNVSTHVEDVAGGGKWVDTALGRKFVRPKNASPSVAPSSR
jgi:hypothetical protein